MQHRYPIRLGRRAWQPRRPSTRGVNLTHSTETMRQVLQRQASLLRRPIRASSARGKVRSQSARISGHWSHLVIAIVDAAQDLDVGWIVVPSARECHSRFCLQPNDYTNNNDGDFTINCNSNFIKFIFKYSFL